MQQNIQDIAYAEQTSATLLVDNGGDITSLKRHGGWKSTSVAEGYVEESLTNKKQTALKILSPIDYNAGTSTEISAASEFCGSIETEPTNVLNNNFPTTVFSKDNQIGTKLASSGLNIQNYNLQNCTFNINLMNKDN